VDGAPGPQRSLCGEDVSVVASVGSLSMGIIFPASAPLPQTASVV
jgi:hypothetical protein